MELSRILSSFENLFDVLRGSTKYRKYSIARPPYYFYYSFIGNRRETDDADVSLSCILCYFISRDRFTSLNFGYLFSSFWNNTRYFIFLRQQFYISSTIHYETFIFSIIFFFRFIEKSTKNTCFHPNYHRLYEKSQVVNYYYINYILL